MSCRKHAHAHTHSLSVSSLSPSLSFACHKLSFPRGAGTRLRLLSFCISCWDEQNVPWRVSLCVHELSTFLSSPAQGELPRFGRCPVASDLNTSSEEWMHFGAGSSVLTFSSSLLPVVPSRSFTSRACTAVVPFDTTRKGTRRWRTALPPTLWRTSCCS